MRYPQAPTLILCDNQCAVGLATNLLKAKREEEEEDSYFSDEEFADDEYAEVLNSHSFDFIFVSFHPHSLRRQIAHNSLKREL